MKKEKSTTNNKKKTLLACLVFVIAIVGIAIWRTNMPVIEVEQVAVDGLETNLNGISLVRGSLYKTNNGEYFFYNTAYTSSNYKTDGTVTVSSITGASTSSEYITLSDGKRAYCITPGSNLNSGNTLGVISGNTARTFIATYYGRSVLYALEHLTNISVSNIWDAVKNGSSASNASSYYSNNTVDVTVTSSSAKIQSRTSAGVIVIGPITVSNSGRNTFYFQNPNLTVNGTSYTASGLYKEASCSNAYSTSTGYSGSSYTVYIKVSTNSTVGSASKVSVSSTSNIVNYRKANSITVFVAQGTATWSNVGTIKRQNCIRISTGVNYSALNVSTSETYVEDGDYRLYVGKQSYTGDHDIEATFSVYASLNWENVADREATESLTTNGFFNTYKTSTSSIFWAYYNSSVTTPGDNGTSKTKKVSFRTSAGTFGSDLPITDCGKRDIIRITETGVEEDYINNNMTIYLVVSKKTINNTRTMTGVLVYKPDGTFIGSIGNSSYMTASGWTNSSKAVDGVLYITTDYTLTTNTSNGKWAIKIWVSERRNKCSLC